MLQEHCAKCFAAETVRTLNATGLTSLDAAPGTLDRRTGLPSPGVQGGYPPGVPAGVGLRERRAGASSREQPHVT